MVDMSKWIEIDPEFPEEGKVVLTKIQDQGGIRNIQKLVRQGPLYYFPDMSMYVYYTPTHFLQDDIYESDYSGRQEF